MISGLSRGLLPPQGSPCGEAWEGLPVAPAASSAKPRRGRGGEGAGWRSVASLRRRSPVLASGVLSAGRSRSGVAVRPPASLRPAWGQGGGVGKGGPASGGGWCPAFPRLGLYGAPCGALPAGGGCRPPARLRAFCGLAVGSGGDGIERAAPIKLHPTKTLRGRAVGSPCRVRCGRQRWQTQCA